MGKIVYPATASFKISLTLINPALIGCPNDHFLDARNVQSDNNVQVLKGSGYSCGCHCNCRVKM